MVQNRFVGIGRQGKAQAARELDGAQHANRILAKSHFGVADRPNEPGLEVLQSPDVVDHRKIGDVVKEPVDRKVAPQGVLPGAPERVVRSHQQFRRIGIDLVGPPAESGDLDHLPFRKQDVRQAEPPPDQATIAEEPADRLRMGVGADIEIFGHAGEQKVSHASADQIRFVSRGRQAIEDLQGIGVDRLAGNGMGAPRADAWRSMLGTCEVGSGTSNVWICFADGRLSPVPRPVARGPEGYLNPND